jgi:hypothetical protein
MRNRRHVASTKPGTLEWNGTRRKNKKTNFPVMQFRSSLDHFSLFFSLFLEKRILTQIFSLTLSLSSSTPLTQFQFLFLPNIIKQIKLLINNNYMSWDYYYYSKQKLKLKLQKRKKKKLMNWKKLSNALIDSKVHLIQQWNSLFLLSSLSLFPFLSLKSKGDSLFFNSSSI